MPYKTILIHLNDERRARRLLEAGLAVARQFEAHVIGLHVFPAYRLTPPIPLPIGADVLGQIRATIRESTDRIKAAFDAATAGSAVAAEWRAITSEQREAALIVLDHARAADLVIVSQTDPDWDLSMILDFPGRLAIEGGRPILVVPNNGPAAVPPKRIVVGWNGRREAARALFDALPFLKLAEQVHVITVAEREDACEGGLPDTEVAAALSRHGVKVKISKERAAESSAGEQIHTDAMAERADLLVMGAYGHSRLREFVFGGVTDHMLRQMQLPVLLSH